MIEILAQIDAPPNGKGGTGFVAGLVLWNDRVAEAADIVRYMRGWSRQRVREYCAKRQWTITIVITTERFDIRENTYEQRHEQRHEQRRSGKRV